jgi:hypothetical protein
MPHPTVHWIVPVLAGIPFGWGTFASFLSCMTYIMDTYLVTNSASVVAANGAIRFALGAVFPLFITQVYQNLGVHWAGSLFACLGFFSAKARSYAEEVTMKLVATRQGFFEVYRLMKTVSLQDVTLSSDKKNGDGQSKLS